MPHERPAVQQASRGARPPSSDHQHILMKVETHNHPTAISPFPGASTGAGGEIRDEGATGRGSKPKAGSDRLYRVQAVGGGAGSLVASPSTLPARCKS